VFNYDNSVRLDILPKLELMLRSGALKFDSRSGALLLVQNQTWETPWYHIKGVGYKPCGIYMNILFKLLDVLPSGCLSCWKVVVRPRTLRELFALKRIMEELDLPSKCGIERRDYVKGLYGGYFYNDSYEEGTTCYRVVRAVVDEQISPDIPVMLKRGCTEMEMRFGDPREWKQTTEMSVIERLLMSNIVHDNYPSQQNPLIINHVLCEWVRWAYSHGDETYKDYTGGEDIGINYVRFNEDEGTSQERGEGGGRPEDGPENEAEGGDS